MTMISDWNLNLKENERIDDLLAGGLKIIQNNKEFCFSIDAVLLAHFVTVRKNAKGLDLGTGTGVIPLLLSNRAMKMDALEINPVTCEIAKRNMVMNKLQDKICVQEGDLCKIKEYTSIYGLCCIQSTLSSNKSRSFKYFRWSGKS